MSITTTSYIKIATGRVFRLGLVGMLSLGLVHGALAQSLIVRATGPSASQFQVGSALTPEQGFTLRQGDAITVLYQGSTQRFTGPGQFTLQRTSKSNVDSAHIAVLITKSQTKMRTRGGFTRSATPNSSIGNDRLQAPNLWLLDYRKGGNFCVAATNWLFLWRPDTRKEETVTLESRQTDIRAAQTLTFAHGTNYQRWPVDSVAVIYGQPYYVSGTDMAEPIAVTLQPLGDVPETIEATAKALLNKGCTGQLDRLIDSLNAS